MVFADEWLWWKIISELSSWVYAMWLWSSLLYTVTKQLGIRESLMHLTSRLKGELQPLYWPAFAVNSIDIMQSDDNVFFKIIIIAAQFGVWFVFKDVGDDNDRWKRRGEKLHEKIVELANGRLGVSPA
jgi:hypothetical protein